MVRQARRDRRLMSVLLELTYACNLDCFFCYNDRAVEGRPLTLEQYHRLLDELAGLGVWTLTLSGGEPLAHPDFFEIGRRARELGFVVRVKTNGHALHRAIAERVRVEIDPYVLEISLHGATAETHDRQTRVPGSFERLMANLDALRAVGQRARLRGTLTGWNGHELEAMFALADRLELPLDMQTEVTPRDDGSKEPLGIRPALQDRMRLVELRLERSHRTAQTKTSPGSDPAAAVSTGDRAEPNCGAGISGLAVDPVGNVYPCVQWRRPLGNLHEQRIGEIWAGSPALRQVRTDNVAASRVPQDLGVSGDVLFCPGAAEQEQGRPDVVYDELRAQMRASSAR
jgi:MoaA/NifB/PqqE/SkfB family radical SAM enzyme